MSKKIKIAFIKFGGCAAGGTEKFLQTIAAHLPKKQFEVDYYYTNAAPYIGSDWKHPPNELERINYLKKHNINLIEVKVEYKDITKPHHPWTNTNFWDLFDPTKYDIVQTARAGHAEYPFTEINNTWIVDILTLPGMAERKENVFKTIHISKFQASTWVKAGGDSSKIEIIPIVSNMDKQKSDLRKELKIPGKAFVYGLHQRSDDGIFSPVALMSFKQLQDKEEENKSWFIVLGGSDLYSKQAKELGLKNFVQLKHSGDFKKVSQFLNTLDVFTHARKDGETFGLAISEALFHGLPIVSHVAPAMGHVETIGEAGFVCSTPEEYFEKMLELKNDVQLYKKLSDNAVNRYENNYTIKIAIEKIAKIYEEAVKAVKPWETSGEDYWENMWK